MGTLHPASLSLNLNGKRYSFGYPASLDLGGPRQMFAMLERRRHRRTPLRRKVRIGERCLAGYSSASSK